MQWTTTQSKKGERTPAIYSNIVKAGGHCAQRNKPKKDKYCIVSLTCGT